MIGCRKFLGSDSWVTGGVYVRYWGRLAPPRALGARGRLTRRWTAEAIRTSIAENGKPDLAHVHWGLACEGQQAIETLSELDVPVVLTEHAGRFFQSLSDDDQVFRRYSLIAKHARVVSAVSECLATEMTNRTGLGDIRVVPNAIDPLFHWDGRVQPSGDLRLVIVGTHAVKGAEIALDGIRRFSERGFRVDVRIVGEKASRFAKGASSDRVVLRSASRLSPAELASEYRHADFLICMSRHETFGCAPVEAAMTGCGIVATRVGVLGDLVDAGCGVIVDRDPTSLSEALFRLQSDLATWRCCRMALAHTARSLFGAQTVRARLRELYESAVRRG